MGPKGRLSRSAPVMAIRRVVHRVGVGAAGRTATIELCGSHLELPGDHLLPRYRRQDAHYAENLGEVARLVARAGGTTMVDVGANVGDSVAIVKAYAPTMRVLCVDADARYLPYLRTNTARWPDVELAVPVCLAERSTEIAGTVVGGTGTSRIELGAGTGVVPTSTLDDLLAAHPRFHAPALVKSDTDGFEDRVLRGATRTLERTPVLFLEYDPKLMRAAGDDGLALLTRLREHGYERIAFYDKFGTLMVRCSLDDRDELRDLDAYATANSPRGVDHYDVVVAAPADGPVVDGLPVRAGGP